MTPVRAQVWGRLWDRATGRILPHVWGTVLGKAGRAWDRVWDRVVARVRIRVWDRMMGAFR